MEKICLIEAGNYLLGIDSGAVIRGMDMDEFLAAEGTRDTSLISPSSLFDQHSPVISRSDLFVVELETSAEPLTLVVDRVVGEIDKPEHFIPLPPLYPELASDCCPQIMVHNDQPVLLLNGTGLDSLHSQLKEEYGSFSPDALQNSLPTRENLSVEVEEPPITEEASTCSEADLNERTFQTIVTWTIGEYLEHGSDDTFTLSVDELPAYAIPSDPTQKGSKELLQRLIDITLVKCRGINDAMLERLKRKNSGVKS